MFACTTNSYYKKDNQNYYSRNNYCNYNNDRSHWRICIFSNCSDGINHILRNIRNYIIVRTSVPYTLSINPATYLKRWCIKLCSYWALLTKGLHTYTELVNITLCTETNACIVAWFVPTLTWKYHTKCTWSFKNKILLIYLKVWWLIA